MAVILNFTSVGTNKTMEKLADSTVPCISQFNEFDYIPNGVVVFSSGLAEHNSQKAKKFFVSLEKTAASLQVCLSLLKGLFVVMWREGH